MAAKKVFLSKFSISRGRVFSSVENDLIITDLLPNHTKIEKGKGVMRSPQRDIVTVNPISDQDEDVQSGLPPIYYGFGDPKDIAHAYTELKRYRRNKERQQAKKSEKARKGWQRRDYLCHSGRLC